MAIRLRTVGGRRVAVCAARSVAKPGDLYLDDADHAEDFASEGYNIRPLYTDEAQLRSAEESNNPAREWWDRTNKGEG